MPCSNTALLLNFSLSFFLINCYYLNYRSLQKSSLDQDCVLQDGVKIPNRRQSPPSEYQIYTENLQEKGKALPYLHHRSYQSQVTQLVAAFEEGTSVRIPLSF